MAYKATAHRGELLKVCYNCAIILSTTVHFCHSKL